MTGIIERCLDQCIWATVLTINTKYGDSPVRIDEFLDVDASWADDLGIHLAKDGNGNSKFDGHSDIRGMEHEDMRRAILKPLVKAMLKGLTDDDLLYLKLLRDKG